MSDPTYFGVLTSAGAAAEAYAAANNTRVNLTHIAVGDGGGPVPTPTAAATALVNETYRQAIGSYAVDATDAGIMYLSVTLPTTAGGWWIREIGVWAENPSDPTGGKILYAYFNHAPTYKQLITEGQATTHELKIPVVYTSDGHITISINESGYATQQAFLQLCTVIDAMRTRSQAAWTLTAAVAENGTLTLPAGISYIVGKKQIALLTWENVPLVPGEQFDEFGKAGEASTTLKLLFPAAVGDHFYIHLHGDTVQPTR